MKTRSASRVHGLAVALTLALAVVLAACASPPPPPPPPALEPAGPIDARVNSIVAFNTVSLEGPLVWSVDGVAGGSAATGTVANGTYQAPSRIPAGTSVTVAAAEAATPTNNASAEVNIIAPGTLYVMDEAVYVFNDLDVVEGDTAPDRTFAINGVVAGADYYDMVIAPALDMAFIGVNEGTPSVYRLANVAAADGVVNGVDFSTGVYEYPSGFVYDAQRDILYVVVGYALLAFHDASTAPAGSGPDRIVEGVSLNHFLVIYDMRLNLDATADRLFVSSPDGIVAVYDQASTIDGEAQPDREFYLDFATVPFNYLWGAAYDVTRDELYLADQTSAYDRPIMVIANASTASGEVVPDRTIGGPATEDMWPSQISYDAANDRLIAVDTFHNDVKVFDNASTLDGDVAPSRVIGGANLPIDYAYSGYVDPTQ